MKWPFIIVSLLIAFTIISCGNTFKPNENHKDRFFEIPEYQYVSVVRTDFSNDSLWYNLKKQIQRSGRELGFQANVHFLNKHQFHSLNSKRIITKNSTYNHPFIFLADSFTFTHHEHPILCIDLTDTNRNSFRVIPSEMWSVENNLSLTNIDFDEFLNNLDSHGIHRGFNE